MEHAGPAAVAPPFNTLAIIAFILSLCCVPVVAPVLGFVARKQIKQTGERGIELAVAAIVIGLIALVPLLAVLALAIVQVLLAA